MNTGLTVALTSLFVVMLAGCANEAPADDGFEVGNGTQVDLDDVETTVTTGAIAGVVVDETISPIGGINVSIDGTDHWLITEEDGVFRFAEMEPGIYFVDYDGPDHFPAQNSAEVAAGEVTKLRTIMAADTTPKPYHTTLVYDWFDSAGQPLVDFAWDLLRPDGLPPMCDVCEWTFQADMAVETLIIEAVWEDSIEPPHKPSEFYWTIEPTADTSDYESDYFYSPGLVRLDGNRWGAHDEFFLMLAYEEEWIAVDQKAEVFVTMFYGAEAPEGFSMVEES